MNKFNDFVNILSKIILILCGIIFLVIYYQSTLNQRFQFHKMYPDSPNSIVFDTKTGDLYFSKRPELGEWTKQEPIKIATPE